LGGVIALEMAQQLQRAGQEITLLALLDSWAPSAYTFSGAGTLSEAALDAHLLAEFLTDLRGRFADHLPPLPGNFSELNQAEQLHYVVEQARLLETVLPEGGLPQLHELLRVFQSNSRAVRNYRPRPYTGKMVLFRAGEETTGVDPSLGWADLATGSLELCTVPGNHYTMLAEPHVQALTEQLRGYLNRSINGLIFSS
jgi:thioesterase domain-containing protein